MGARTAPKQNSIVAAAVGSMNHIATLPEITMRIIDLVEDPTSTAQDLHNVIASDPALCSRILKVVNSAFYGLPRQIASIDRAIVLLGLNAVKNIAVAASLSKLFRGGDLCPAFSARDLWLHSVATAGAAKLIADELGISNGDEAFLAGLIHDVGVIVELQTMHAKLIAVFDEIDPAGEGTPQGDMREAERQHLGADHTEFGAGLCEAWKFPPTLVAVTGGHHEPASVAQEHRLLAMIVHVADRLAARAGKGFRLDLTDFSIDDATLQALRLGPEQIDRVLERLPEQCDDVEALFA